MKPKIFFMKSMFTFTGYGWWVCVSDEGFGCGNSPKLAYGQWLLRKLKRQIELGLPA